MDTKELLDRIAEANRRYQHRISGRTAAQEGGGDYPEHAGTVDADDSTPEGREYLDEVESLLAEWRASNPDAG